MSYKAIIGLEVHCELKTDSKMFCGCANGQGLERHPNINICPVCSGQPGTLPVPNKTALEAVIKAGLALNCAIAKESKFDRKNYFYPDLPKGYQISQYDMPLCEAGRLDYIDYNTGVPRSVRITRIHMEEDTGKSLHDTTQAGSLIDLNRAGVPLMELVTEADIRSASEARSVCQELQRIFRYLGISDADMEKGQMRCEANISIMPVDLEETVENYGTKVEIKNLNSFRSVEKSIEYELARQADVLATGEKVIQETRGWHDKKQNTFSQRIKEGSADYRYFPEPDIPPMVIEHDDFPKTEDQLEDKIYLRKLKAELPELPHAKELRYVKEYTMDHKDAKIITDNKNIADYMERVFSDLREWYESYYKGQRVWEDDQAEIVKMATGWFTSKMFKLLNDAKVDIKDTKVTAENFAELMAILHTNQINSSAGQTVLEEMFKHGYDPSQVIDDNNLLQENDSDKLGAIIDQVITNNPDQVEQYKAGKTTVLQFLLGQVMRESKGKANPQVATELLEQRLIN